MEKKETYFKVTLSPAEFTRVKKAYNAIKSIDFESYDMIKDTLRNLLELRGHSVELCSDVPEFFSCLVRNEDRKTFRVYRKHLVPLSAAETKAHIKRMRRRHHK